MELTQLEKSISRFNEMREQYLSQKQLPNVILEAIKESLLQRFEYSIEVSWKTVKRYLVTYEGYEKTMGPKSTIRTAGELGILNSEKWMVFLQLRQDIAHDYSHKKAVSSLQSMEDFHLASNELLISLKNKMS